MGRVLVATKAAKSRIVVAKQAKEPEWRTLHGAADSMRNQMMRALTRAFSRFQDTVNLSSLERAFEATDLGGAEAAIPWDELEETLFGEVELIIAEIVRRGGNASVKHLPPSIGAQMRFDLLNPRSVDFIREHTAELVREITQETRRAIQGIIERAFHEGMHPRQSSRYIRNLVGLTERQARAVDNYRRRLIADGAPQGRAAQMAQSYARRLERTRALTIARTETLRAANEGQNLLWQQGVAEGRINPATALREWIVTPDGRLCEICEPLDGQRVGMDEDFQTALGPVHVPPVHPNCRCAISLHIED